VTIIGIIGVGGRGGWGRGLHNRRWRSFSGDDVLLVHLLFFFVGVAEDDDLAVIERLKEPVVEVAEESPGKLCIPRGIRDEIFLI
jgi:hypothetical protein